MADAKNLFKKLGKKVLKKLVFSKIFIIAIIGIIIFMMLFSGLIYILDLIEGVLKEGDLKNVPYAASTYTNGVTISSQGLTTEMTPQELWDSMIQNGSNVKKYLKSPQELEKLMKAEIVTQNPKIGKGDLDGIIEFKRRKTDKSVIDLKYVDEETFNSYIDAYNENGDETALGYYTIDTNGNALIAQWTKKTKTVEVSVDGETPTSETTVEYSMSSSMINYKSVVQKYSMPFDYLWALLITTNGKKFVLELADYVIEDSSIDITGIEDYKSATDFDGPKSETISVEVEKRVKDPESGAERIETETVQKTKTTTITTTIETNNVNADLTKADTWMIDYKKDENGNVTSKPKVDKDSNKRNFITILNKYLYTKQNLDSSALMLFEILERNTSTANMVKLTKYLLYVATGNYYGVKEYDFSEYEQNSFNPVTASGDISMTTTVLTKEQFKEALIAYSNKGASGNKSNFDKNFLPRIDMIYDTCVDNGFNPELVISFALKESGYNDEGTNNFWGLETPNGKSLKRYSSFEVALLKLFDIWSSYMPGASKASMINQRAADRQAANCNTNGYGPAGTLKGTLSVYSDLCGENTKHREGDSGNGGNYYLKVIYGKDFDAKCGNVHKIGVDDYTIQEKADYTAWLYEQQLSYWSEIFGDFGTLLGPVGTFERYYQSDKRWASNPYNYEPGKTIGDGGCGACALAMAVTGLTGNRVTPDVIVSFLNSQNTNTVAHGDVSSKLVANKYGLTYEVISRSDKTKIDAALDQGKCLIFSIGYNGIYTGKGHFIMCYKRDEKGYYVLESGSYYNDSKPYDFNQVFTSGSQGIFALGR